MARHILQLKQGTAEWLEHRRAHRNASESPAVLGFSPWLSPYMLWELKTGRRVQEVNFAMKRGSALEPAARRCYELLTGIVMEPAVVVDDVYSASLDGITYAEDLVLEMKVPLNGRSSETWKAAEEGKVVPHYVPQVQHQLMVTGADVAHFFVYDDDSGEGVLVEATPQERSQEALREAWDMFWGYMERDEAPPLGPLDTVVRTDDIWRMAATRFLASKQTSEQAGKVLEQARSELLGLVTHSSQEGFGISVSRYFKAKSSKPEFRVSIKAEEPYEP